MKTLELHYNSYDLATGDGPEEQALTVSVTPDFLRIITGACDTPQEQWEYAFNVEEMRKLNTLANVCDGLELLSGRSIYKRGEINPKRFAYGPAYGLEIVSVDELIEDEEDEDDNG